MRRLVGIHAVAAALRAADRHAEELERVIVARGRLNARLQGLVDECRRRSIPVRFETRSAIQRAAGTSAHQGIVALAAAGRYADLTETLDGLPDGRALVVLDQVQDPRNLGAIIRTADAAGAGAVVLPERRSAGLGEATSKAAAGAVESVPVVRVKNLGRAIDAIKSAGFWAYGLDAGGGTAYDRVEYNDRCALVLGGESHGLRVTIKRRCDFLVSIPMAGAVPSLNVSVAAGVALFEIGRQRRRDDRGQVGTMDV